MVDLRTAVEAGKISSPPPGFSKFSIGSSLPVVSLFYSARQKQARGRISLLFLTNLNPPPARINVLTKL
jgi:hypothetical protein